MTRKDSVLGLLMICLVAAFSCQIGCTRTAYRVRADNDSYRILHQKTDYTPWMPPATYNVVPDPRSRFYDPTPTDDPLLPLPAPQLYCYQLPELARRDPDRFDSSSKSGSSTADHTHDPAVQTGSREFPRIFRLPPISPPSQLDPFHVERAPAGQPMPVLHGKDTLASGQQGPFPFRQQSYQEPADMPSLQAPQLPDAGDSAPPRPDNGWPEGEVVDLYGTEVRIAPIPESAWQAIPASCLRRMLEFETIREEFRRTFKREPTEADLDQSRRLALEDIIELSSINNRDYQTEKEVLYRVALALSLERFAYFTKFSTNNNSSNPIFRHSRNNGITVNTLAVPSTLQMDKMLITGGDLLARFANDVLLTFNGPQGFAVDVGSELFFELSQSLLQRDIRFEGLTQAERNVIYAARDFTRFRKELFVDLSSDYYGLLQSYRNIEIQSQNYFAFVRSFDRQRAEYREDLIARFALDQTEQAVIQGLSDLLDRCNSLEVSLDGLKLNIGLPTEMPINLDLIELEQITLGDEAAVTADLINRVRERLEEERNTEPIQRIVLLSTAIKLIEHLLESASLEERQGRDSFLRPDELVLLRVRMLVDVARAEMRLSRVDLESELTSETSTLAIVLQRRLDLIERLINLAANQIELAPLLNLPEEDLNEMRRQLTELERRMAEQTERLENIIAEKQLDALPQVDAQLEQIQDDVQQLVESIDRQSGVQQLTPDQEIDLTLSQVDSLLEQAEAQVQAAATGLVPIEIDMDDAMLTALVQRFELMNQRGFLADDWRQIKLAADDLKSVLTLTASQSIRTRDDVNRVFDFTWRESETQIRARFDAPLNRRAQRNTFRRTLIDYQAALRQLIQLEDNIKFAVRNDLRNLTLDRQQYDIQVANAALAFERVISTQIEFQQGLSGVRNEDVLDAQRAYTASLTNVVGQHVSYIVDRLSLFLNLEELTVDEVGFWPEVYDLEFQPTPHFQLPPYSEPAYGCLPPVLYSHKIKRMNHVPTGVSGIQRQQDQQQDQTPGQNAGGAYNGVEALPPIDPRDTQPPPNVP